MRDDVDPRAMGILSGVRWWAGWRPVTTVLGGGGLLGLLLANALLTRWLRWLGRTAGVTDVVRTVAGPIVFFLVLGVAVGAVFLWSVLRRYRERTDGAVFRAFMASNAYLGLLLVAVLLDTLIV